MSIPRTRLKGVVLTLVGVTVVSPDSLLIRLMQTDIWTVLFFRGALGGVTLYVISLLLERPTGVKGFQRMGLAGLAVAVSYTACTLCFVYAVTHTTVANTLVIMSVSPILGAFLSRIFVGEDVPRRTWLAAIVIVSGLVIIFRASLDGSSIAGDLAALGAAVLLATKFVIVRSCKEISMVPAIAVGSLMTGLIALPFAVPVVLSSEGYIYALLLGLVLVPLGTSMTTLGPRYLLVPESGLIMLLEVLLAPLWVWLVIREMPSTEALAGGILILGALTLLLAGSLRSYRRRRV